MGDCGRPIECFTCRQEKFEEYLTLYQEKKVDHPRWCQSFGRGGVWHEHFGNLSFRHRFDPPLSGRWGGEGNGKGCATAILNHHLSAHGLDTEIRLMCTRCLSYFNEPEGAIQHVRMSRKLAAQDLYMCSLCPHKGGFSKQRLIDHAAKLHNAYYDDYMECFHNRNVDRLVTDFFHFPGDMPLFWTWTGRYFSHWRSFMDGSRSRRSLSAGCCYVPKWPFYEVYACGLCNFRNRFRKRTVQHLKDKHKVETPNDFIPASSAVVDKEEESDQGELASGSECESDGSSRGSGPGTFRFGRGRAMFVKRHYCSLAYCCSSTGCLRLFDTEPALFQHTDRSHPFMDNDDHNFHLTGEDLCCSFCADRFPSERAKEQHERARHTQLMQQDDSCARTHAPDFPI